MGRGAVGGRGPPGRTDRRRPSPHRDMPHALGPAVCGVRGWFLRFPRQRRGPPPVTGSVSEPFQAPSRAGRESASVLLCRATASSPSLSCPSPVLSHVTRVAGSVSQCLVRGTCRGCPSGAQTGPGATEHPAGPPGLILFQVHLLGTLSLCVNFRVSLSSVFISVGKLTQVGTELAD